MKLQLRTKLLIGFIVVALIGSAIGALGIQGILSINEADTRLGDRITIPTGQLVEMVKNFELLRVYARSTVMVKEVKDIEAYETQFAAAQKIVLETGDKFASTILSDSGKADYAKFLGAVKGYIADYAQVVQSMKAGKPADALAMIDGQGRTDSNTAADAADSLVASKTQLTTQTLASNSNLSTSLIILMLSITGVGFVISIILAIWMGVFMVSRPLMKISDTLSAGAGQISGASGQLTAASQDIANGASEQASSIEETSSSMEELSSMVKQNVANAKETSILADKAAEASTSGADQMQAMLTAMDEINRSSNKIQKVIKVIDDIAFKTNILALNAAVEAARAGEAGMGFAVVADEVKNLANRSADAAKETADMIEDSLKKTSGGLEMANKLAEVFKDILTTAKKVSEMAREVETASTQQDTGIEQVNKAIVQFDEVVQTNASSAEETASAAEELQSQVGSLNEMVAQLTKLVTGKVTLVAHEDHGTSRLATHAAQARTRAEALNQHKPAQKVHTLPHHTGPQSKTGRSREVSPEQLIPFEDDDDLK